MNRTRHGSRITVHDRTLRTTVSKHATAQTRPPPRRPNGRTAACDPCRLRKLACDHNQPICGRCARSRGTENICTYTASTSGGRAPLSKIISSVIAVSPPRASVTDTNDAKRLAKEDGSGSVEFNCLPSRSSASGFYSHNAALEEIRANLLFPVVEQSHQINENDGQASSSVRFSQLPTVVREKSLFILKTIFNLIDSQVDVQGGQQHSGWVHMAVPDILQSLQNLMRPLKNGSDQGGLERIAERIFEATQKPFKDHEPNPQKWLHQFCGANLRWESLGLIWPYLERITDPVDYFYKPLIKWTATGITGEVARTCLDYCIQLAKFCGEPHDLLLHLCWYRATMDSVLYGDGTMSTFTSHGHSVTMMIFLRTHALVIPPSYTPSISSEFKKRTFATIFVCDKLDATFTGRPPLIGRRFVSTPMPLDIRDEELMGDDRAISKAIQSLDPQGWNTNGFIFPVTVLRARYLIALIRDEIIEVAHNNSTEPSREYLMDLLSRQLLLPPSFPSGLYYDPQQLAISNNDFESLYLRAFVHLEHLHNIFLIQRLLIRYGNDDDGQLLTTSLTMVKITLYFWIHKDQFTTPYDSHFEWWFLAYAAPGSGILCKELLQPTFTAKRPKDPQLTRSIIIQQLSLLNVVFEWIRPSDLSTNCKDIIQRVLDQHLDLDTGLIGDSIDTEVQGFGYLAQPDFSFDLLDTFSWLRSED